MNKNVTELKAPINKDSIKLLEEAMAMVKKGEISQIALAWVGYDNSIGGCVSEGAQDTMMWASLEHNARECYKNIVLRD